MELDAERTGLGRYVDVAVTGDDVELAKPDPASVVAAIAALGVSPREALYVGDGPNDVRAGRGAGARTVGVAYGFHPAEMRAERPDTVVERPLDVLALVTPG
jgi:phosphoglycolate phosphatase-like HAD superfamily hydrolase